MAQRVQVILEDDVDGGQADETVTFALDGTDYEIDLSETNASSLRDELGRWVIKARRTGGRRRRAASTNGAGNGASAGGDTKEIRDWAIAEGLSVSTRGRVSGEVREAYAKAH